VVLTPTPISSAEVFKNGRAIPLPTVRALVACIGGIFPYFTFLKHKRSV
jgi:hypothetical protein